MLTNYSLYLYFESDILIQLKCAKIRSEDTVKKTIRKLILGQIDVFYCSYCLTVYKISGRRCDVTQGEKFSICLPFS